MMPASLDAAAGSILSWLLTYAVHSTILLAIAAATTWRFASHHAWLDQVWKAALVAPLLTASLQIDALSLAKAVPLGGHRDALSVTAAASDSRDRPNAGHARRSVRTSGRSYSHRSAEGR